MPAHARVLHRQVAILLNAAGGTARGWNGRGRHQPQRLQENDGVLRRAAPHELTSFTLTVLDVDVAAGILQTAVAERAIDKDSLVEDKVLALKYLIVESIHG